MIKVNEGIAPRRGRREAQWREDEPEGLRTGRAQSVSRAREGPSDGPDRSRASQGTRRAASSGAFSLVRFFVA